MTPNNDPRSLCEQACAEEGRSCERAETRRERDEADRNASKLAIP